MPNNQVTGDDEACELKAGHPPAVKVGNMRVTQRNHPSSSSHADKKDEDAADDSTVPSACSFAPKTLVKSDLDGVVEKVASKTVSEAVKHIHEKPQVSHEYRGQQPKTHSIQQPRNNC